MTPSACPGMAARASGSCPAWPVTVVPPGGSSASARRWCTRRGSWHLTRAPLMRSRCVVDLPG